MFLRARFSSWGTGEAGVVRSIFVSLKTLPSSSPAVAEAIDLLERLVDSRPTDADSGGARDAVLAHLDIEMPALLELLEVHQANEKHVAEFLWILNQICETHGQKVIVYPCLPMFHACMCACACGRVCVNIRALSAFPTHRVGPSIAY